MPALGGEIKLATFNVNSIRSRTQIVLDWMQETGCDVLCVQETKVRDSEFPVGAFESAGLFCAFHGQKTYNGVAIISKIEPDEVVYKLTEEDEEARLIRARFGDINIINTYIPQGTAVGTDRFAYKLNWFSNLRDYVSNLFSPQDKVIWVGDLNVAREHIDVYDPEKMQGNVCFHPEEWAALDDATAWGFVDIFRKHHPGEPDHYSFWDYRIPNALKRRLGWRLDYILATEPLANRSVDCYIDKAPRLLPKPSDHTPVIATFNLDQDNNN